MCYCLEGPSVSALGYAAIHITCSLGEYPWIIRTQFGMVDSRLSHGLPMGPQFSSRVGHTFNSTPAFFQKHRGSSGFCCGIMHSTALGSQILSRFPGDATF